MHTEKDPQYRLGRMPEIWLTPLLGVLGLCFYSFHDHLSLWHSLNNRFVAAILFSVPFLMVSGFFLRFMKATVRSVWIGILIAAIFNGILVGGFYAYLAAHYFDLFQTCPPDDWESCGDIRTIWQGEADMAGIIGALATLMSGFVTWFAMRNRDKQRRSPSNRA